MYPLVALLLFGFFGLAAVTIDLGLVTLTRVRMQNASDTAALEGLRQRDALGDAGRRQAAAAAAALSFDPGFQQPTPQANASNARHGDLVAGEYAPGPAAEASDYSRNDFTPATPPAAGNASAFLARLRRTNDLQGLDNIPGVSSSGPVLPLLFGQASLVQAAPGSAYDPREDGFTARATSIAVSRPAARIGASSATSFALESSFWQAMVPGSLTSAEADGNGAIRVGAVQVGRFILPALVIGSPLSTIMVPPNPVLSGYVPLFQNIDGLDRVIGFGRVTVLGGPIGPISIRRETGQMASANATAHLQESPPVSAAGWAAVLAANRALTGALEVPVLVQ